MDPDLLALATQLHDAIREVEEQRALVQKLHDDVAASRSAYSLATRKLHEVERAEEAAYRRFSGRDDAVEPVKLAPVADWANVVAQSSVSGWHEAAE